VAAARFLPFFATIQESKFTHIREGQPFDKEGYKRHLAKVLEIKL